MSSPRIVYFGQAPSQGTGSPIILLRHLRRLAANGWTPELVTEAGQATDCDWATHHLSLRKPWWPPFRPGNPFLRGLRMRLWARECAGFFPPPQAILSYLSLYSEMHSEVAAHYARLCGAPLTVIIHDFPPDFPNFDPRQTRAVLRRHQWIFEQAHQLWFVSPELADQYDLPAARKNVLPPIPEGIEEPARWNPEIARRPLIVYAGFAYPAQMPLFARLGRAIDAAGGRLLILSRPTPELASLCTSAPVDHRDLFPTNREALDFIRTQASGLLVSYSERTDKMPWTRTSFPSKWVEFSQTRLPALLAAPRDTALGHWAERNGYADYVAPGGPGELEKVAAFVEALKTEAGWHEKSAAVARFAETEFNPDVIESAFEAKLEA